MQAGGSGVRVSRFVLHGGLPERMLAPLHLQVSRRAGQAPPPVHVETARQTLTPETPEWVKRLKPFM